MMKTMAASGLTALACLVGAMSMAQAQTQAQTQEYSFPSHESSSSPPSTLRITEQPAAGTASSGAVRDTPESLDQYKRCRNNADREAISNVQLQTEVAACLRELEMRRQQ